MVLRRLVIVAQLILSALVAPRAEAASVRDKLTQVLRTAGDYKQRVAAVIGLARLNDKQVIPVLIDALKDRHSTVRGTAAGALGNLGDARAQSALEALLQRDKDPFVARAAQGALAALLRSAGAGKTKRLDPGQMHVEGTLGSLDQEAAQDGVTARLGQVTACYMRERSNVTNLAGRVDLKFRVTTAGKVRWVRIVRSDLGSQAVEQCILRELAGARFSAPEGGEAEFSIPIGLDPREVILAAGAVATPTRVPPEAKKLVAACKKLGGGALPAGLLLTVYVDPDGVILSAGLSSASGEVPSDIATALVTRLKAFKLPARDDGHIIKVVTPFACRR